MVETINLTKRFKRQQGYRALWPWGRNEEFTAVDGVTLHIKQGELFGLLGPNGAGKSTLAKILCTLIQPSAGRAFVAGRDVVKEAGAVRSVVGLVDTQERSFFWRLSGRQNLEFFAALHNLHGHQVRRRIDDLLDRLNLTEHAERRFMTYSTGMKQKLAIARGLLGEPQILIMDEPTRSLDPVSARDVRAFVRETLVNRQGRTVLLVTHHLDEAESYCDRIAIINRGQVLACSTPNMLRQQFTTRHHYCMHVRALPYPSLDVLQRLPGVAQLHWRNGQPNRLKLEFALDNQQTLADIIKLITASGAEIFHCQANPLTLQQIFTQVIETEVDDCS